MDFEIELFLARQEDGWEQSSAIIAMVHNCRFGAADAKGPEEFNPLRQKGGGRDDSSWEASVTKELERKKHGDG